MSNHPGPFHKDNATWGRGLYMLLFAVFYSVAEFVLVIVCVYQFVSGLITGALNQRLILFSESLCAYIAQILSYVTFRSSLKPFPFSPFPDADEQVISQQ